MPLLYGLFLREGWQCWPLIYLDFARQLRENFLVPVVVGIAGLGEVVVGFETAVEVDIPLVVVVVVVVATEFVETAKKIIL